jgi:hypothetical protein
MLCQSHHCIEFMGVCKRHRVTPSLFKCFPDHIIALKDLSGFTPQDLANISWAYATVGTSHPRLLRRIANHIVMLKVLSGFNSQSLSNIAWAYATGQVAPQLQGARSSTLNTSPIFSGRMPSFVRWTNICSSHSHPCEIKDGRIQQPMFSKHRLVIYGGPRCCSVSRFNSDFICLTKEDDFSLENYIQRHQWQLWQEELWSDMRISPLLRDKCQKALISALTHSSNLQADVTFELLSIGLHPGEEFLTRTGYCLDALVEVKGAKVGIVELDGPSHFVGRKAMGWTLLKRRQVSILDEILGCFCALFGVEHLGMDSLKKQEYLRTLLSFGY